MPQALLTRRRFTAGTALALAGHRAHAQGSGSGFWTLLREGGCVLLMRHAQTEPGVGDPPNFRLGDCGTQRNLSEAGRQQARRVAAALVRERVRIDQVRSSAWCRCVDTAMLAFGQSTAWPPINSFFGSDGRERQTREVQAALSGWMAPRNLALVTHQVNITALTGETPAMGEIFLVRPGPTNRLRVLAREAF
ncbi:histidine phosphatase family protein [Hydrogenophaga sp.]|uniref:histidine phosphatase family protein n=1 Tax=Hydrogenophaga sp. TaxID=1904254 RepID=UPI00261C5433|nr:histidine phosphatase family protein [Hydrogenophaga sp.]MCW5653473.1 histidine phosphatase family protein [Hydrogenophaga sp.]